MSLFKVNCHSHTRYSDGANTLKEMALEAQRLGHCCHVVTDHYYNSKDPESTWCSLTLEKYMRLYREAQELEQELQFPIIIGVESGFDRSEEINVFGHEAILFLFSAKENDYKVWKHMRDNYECACILNHPGLHNFEAKRGPEIIDGYEYANSGYIFFTKRSLPEYLQDKNPFSNSDAHGVNSLATAHNLIDVEIKTETDLIRMIRRGPEKLVMQNPNLPAHIIDRDDIQRKNQ